VNSLNNFVLLVVFHMSPRSSKVEALSDFRNAVCVMQLNSSPDDALGILVIQLSISCSLNPLVSHSAPNLFIYFRQRDGRSKQYQNQKFSSCSA